MSTKKKIVWVSAVIIIAAIAIVICVSLFTKGEASEFDGTLVRNMIDIYNLL